MSADIQISLEALATMIKFDLGVKGKETAGLLIGHEQNGILHIDEVRIGDQTANAVHVEISTEELVMAAIEISERSDGKSIVGWIHTHPGLSAFLSPTDIGTQLIYQAQMPNAVAIVVDAVKYSHTLNLKDLDMGVFRVVDNKAVRLNYAIKDSTEFGLKAFISSDSIIPKTREVIKEVITEAYAPVLNKNKLIIMKANLEKLRGNMASEDISAINAWLEVLEAMQSGDVQEVPLDVVNLNENLMGSIDRLDENLMELEFELEDKSARTGMFVIIFGLILEAMMFYFFINY